MIIPIDIHDLLTQRPAIPVLDVRAPSEFAHGHIPGAINLPIFNDAERAQVGTTYKHEGHDAAVLLGFDLTGPKWSGFIREALQYAPGKKLVVHCWRGGMRSGAMAWALSFYGFEVSVLKGGYKMFRRWALGQFEKEYPLRVIGGMTGSGKTAILKALAGKGESCIDLEHLAQHRGSSYGTMNAMVQPTQEQFENDLALELFRIDAQRPIWIEDESPMIGRCAIPRPLWRQMLAAPFVNITVPPDARVEALVNDYGSLDSSFLIECTERIRKRLGPEQTQRAVAAIREARMHDFVREVLRYYDKTYHTALKHRAAGSIVQLSCDTIDANDNADKILHTFSHGHNNG